MQEPSHIFDFTTPKGYFLNGLWFGDLSAQRVFIFVHGLGSNIFSHHELLLQLLDRSTAVISFNNRGHDTITRIKKLNKRMKKGYVSEDAGAAHEVFTDCVDDIQGVVNAAKEQGVREIFLVGHSTGCQKSVYYLSRQGKQQQVKGGILLAPMSDYAGVVKTTDKNLLEKAQRVALDYVATGRAHELLPSSVWPSTQDAQRFLSLSTSDSEEEIFSYCQPKKAPKTYQKIKIPMLVILAEKDEYRDRSAKQIATWFYRQSRTKNLSVQIIPQAPHNFSMHEKQVVDCIQNWTISL